MSLAERLPFLAPGRPLWNLTVVFLGYVALFPITIPFLVTLVLIDGTDNETIHRLPGISPDGGILTAVSALFYGGVTMFVCLGVLGLAGAATPAPTDSGATAEAPMADGGVDATASQTPTSVPTESSPTTAPSEHTSTSTPQATSTATPTATPTSAPTPDEPGQIVTVVEVVDGDTVDIRYENGSLDTVRLLGVDTPETYSENTPDEFEGVPDNDAGADCLRQWGEDATDHVQSELLGEEVRIIFDDNEPRRGYYGRLLAYIHVDDSLFNRQLVADGYGRVYTDSQFTKKAAFLDVEEEAQQSGTGLWECRNVETQTSTDSQSTGGNVIIETVHEDAAGDEYDNLDDEYVVLTNKGDQSVEMGGWTLSDEADHVYTVPDGFTLDAGASVQIVTGSGTDSDTRLYWGSEAPVWNNAGDTATLEDAGGEEVDSYQYD